MSALPAELMLDPVRQIDGFVHACLVDATSGMILSSVEDQDGLRLPVAAAGATDVINVLSLMTGELGQLLAEVLQSLGGELQIAAAA